MKFFANFLFLVFLLFLFSFRPVSAESKIIPVKMVVYVDYVCPACAYEDELIKKAVVKNPNIQLMIKNFPLPEHKNAFKAAVAAEAAKKQNKFSEMHQKLLATQQEWTDLPDPTDYFYKLAEDVGLDTKKFKSDFNNPEMAKIVEKDVADGKEAKITGTPTVVINDKNYGYFQSEEELNKKIAEAQSPPNSLELYLLLLIALALGITGYIIVRIAIAVHDRSQEEKDK